MLVSCPFRADHKIRLGRMHGPSQCPPPPGERGEHRRLKRLHKKHNRQIARDMAGIVRGVAVAGTGKPSASSGEKAGVKNKVAKMAITGGKR